jgi:hypothetical protein
MPVELYGQRTLVPTRTLLVGTSRPGGQMSPISPTAHTTPVEDRGGFQHQANGGQLLLSSGSNARESQETAQMNMSIIGFCSTE